MSNPTPIKDIDLKELVQDVEKFTEDNIGWDAEPTLICMDDEGMNIIVTPYMDETIKPYEIIPQMVTESKEIRSIVAQSSVLVYVIEGWTHSAEVMERIKNGDLSMEEAGMPSQDPNRRENRIALGFREDGVIAQAIRVRGESEAITLSSNTHDDERMKGPVINALEFAFTIAKSGVLE